MKSNFYKLAVSCKGMWIALAVQFSVALVINIVGICVAPLFNDPGDSIVIGIIAASVFGFGNASRRSSLACRFTGAAIATR